MVSKKIILFSSIIACIYIGTVLFLQNTSFVTRTITGPYPLLYKYTVVLLVMQSGLQTMHIVDLCLLLLNALLTGFIAATIVRRIRQLHSMKKVHIIAGGSSLISLVSGGCAACGLPLLSLLGLSSVVLYLPFKGAELPYISLCLLGISIFFLFRQPKNIADCTIHV